MNTEKEKNTKRQICIYLAFDVVVILVIVCVMLRDYHGSDLTPSAHSIWDFTYYFKLLALILAFYLLIRTLVNGWSVLTNGPSQLKSPPDSVPAQPSAPPTPPPEQTPANKK